MNLHEFTAAQSQLEKRLRDLIGPELARFKEQTGVSVSSVSVELYGIQSISGPISHILGKVATEVDLRTLSRELDTGKPEPLPAADMQALIESLQGVVFDVYRNIKGSQCKEVCELCKKLGRTTCGAMPGKEQP
jgi:hypothetical protein